MMMVDRTQSGIEIRKWVQRAVNLLVREKLDTVGPVMCWEDGSAIPSADIDGEFKQDAVFNFIISISNLKILPGDYDVEISSKLITQFKNKELPLTY